MEVSAINQVGTIGKEWVKSIKANPLRKGVTRSLTVATDTLKETLTKTADGFVILERASKDASEVTIKYPNGFKPGIFYDKIGIVKQIKYPDGSSSRVFLKDGIPVKTDSTFYIYFKDGTKTPLSTTTQGYTDVKQLKKFFLDNIDGFGDAKRTGADFAIADAQVEYATNPTTKNKEILDNLLANEPARIQKLNQSPKCIKTREFIASIDRTK